MVPQSTLRRPTAPYGAYGACGADFFFSFSRPKKPTFSSAFTRRSLELALSAARMTTAHRVSTLLLLTAVAGLLILAHDDKGRYRSLRKSSYHLSMESGQRAPFSPVELAERNSPVALSATKHGVGGSSSWACLPARGGCGDETADGSEGYEEES